MPNHAPITLTTFSLAFSLFLFYVAVVVIKQIQKRFFLLKVRHRCTGKTAKKYWEKKKTIETKENLNTWKSNGKHVSRLKSQIYATITRYPLPLLDIWHFIVSNHKMISFLCFNQTHSSIRFALKPIETEKQTNWIRQKRLNKTELNEQQREKSLLLN